MAFSAKEYRAIFRVAKANGYKLRLCQKPYVYYTYHAPELNIDEPVTFRMSEVLQMDAQLQREEARAARQNRLRSRLGLGR